MKSFAGMALSALVLVTCPVLVRGQIVTIEEPADDIVVVPQPGDPEGLASVKVKVKVEHAELAFAAAGSPDPKVVIQIGQERSSAHLSGDRWLATVRVPDGVTTIKASFGSVKKSARVEVRRDLKPIGQLKVRFVWQDGVDEVLKDIVYDPVTKKPGRQQLESFVEGVQTLTERVFFEAYADINIALVTEDGPDVHTIKMLRTADNDKYGASMTDCGNADRNGKSCVNVGTFGNFLKPLIALTDPAKPPGENDKTFAWPMLPSDSWKVRRDDLGYALGRTAAHETAHELGLVGSQGYACSWMGGSSRQHHPSASGSKRFDNGNYIMDDGQDAPWYRRIGEKDWRQRGSRRSPAVFCPFDLSYLKILYPKESP